MQHNAQPTNENAQMIRHVTSNYTLIETIYRSEQTLVHRAYSSMHDRTVILKQLNNHRPSPLQLARFESEYQVTAHAAAERTVRPLAYTTFEDAYTIVLEDKGALALDQYLQAHELTMGGCLHVALQLVEGVMAVHQKQVIHKDINPSNIIVHPETLETWLIDFGISTRLMQEAQPMRAADQLQGTLAYISPEQTGRMNRALDYRTDFYSLGVALYELLTGRLPFETDDMMEMIHSHLARQPVHPSEARLGVPRVLGDIVMKLMAKTAEERYQTSYGLRMDLTRCQQLWHEHGDIPLFPLGEGDTQQQLVIPQTLVGRAREAAQLRAAFQAAAAGGGVHLVLVSGAAGIGKSFLINEIQPYLVEKRGYLASGKFDQYRRHVPYAALIDALQLLIRQLLAASASELVQWQLVLTKALDGQAGVLTEVVPELELIMGKQPAAEPLSPPMAQNRFRRLMIRLLAVLATAEHPVVVFLDDLQWGDIASFRLLQLLMETAGHAHLLLIGAYRDERLTETDPWYLAMQEMRGAWGQAELGGRLTEIRLQPLGVESVVQMVGQVVQRPQAEVRPLAELVLNKTNGNPFFVGEFLQNLHREGLLNFDDESGRWQWLLADIQQVDITDNVVSLLTQRMRRLTAQEQEVLIWGACVGNWFALDLLAHLRQMSRNEIALALWTAVQEGLLILLGDTYRLAQDSAVDLESLFDLEIVYRFAHDRVQQAAYQLLPEGERPQLHATIGHRWLALLDETALEEHLFDVVGQLNQGMAVLTDEEERQQLAVLNARAGQRARASIAFDTAVTYYRTALSLLPPNQWEMDYELMLQIYQELHTCAYLSGRFTEADQLFQAILTHARTAIDKAPVYMTRLYMLQNLDKNQEAIDLALTAAAELGLKLSARPSLGQIARRAAVVWWLLRQRDVAALADAPVNADPLYVAQLAILSRLGTSSYFLSREALIYMNLVRMELALKHGNNEHTGHVYEAFGLIVAAGLGQYELGERLGHVGTKIVDRCGGAQGADLIIYGGMIRPWVHPVRDCYQMLRDAHQLQLAEGELLNPVYAYQLLTMQMVFQGEPMDVIAAELPVYRETIQQAKDPSGSNYLQVLEGFLAAIQGETAAPTSFDQEGLPEAALLERLKSGQMPVILHRYYVRKLHLHYLFGEYEQALAISAASAEVLDAGFGIVVYLAEHHFYTALTLLALYADGTQSQQRSWWKQIKQSLKQLTKWARHGEANLSHRVKLVEGEMARVKGEVYQAAEKFDEAIELAQTYQFGQIQALAHELAGRLYDGQGRRRLAQSYLAEAHYRYELWGATAKMQALEAQYAGYRFRPSVADRYRREIVPFLATGTNRKKTTGSMEVVETLDLQAMMRASRLITEELNLQKLLQRLLNVVLENAGAQKAVLLRPEGAEWQVSALDQVDTAADHVRPEELVHILPMPLLNYVGRTAEAIILDDALTDPLLLNDPYVLDAQPRSVLCMPLIYKGEPAAILYLENNLAVGAFTAERIEPLRILSAQMATSLENATLYSELEAATERLAKANQTLEKKVEERTSQLVELARAAEAANKAKSSFLAQMSHEIRTPLNTIIGYSEMMYEEAEISGDERVMKDSQLVVRAGRHLLHLVDQVLDLSKIEAGRMELHLQEFSVMELMLDVKITMEPLMRKNNNQYEVVFDGAALGVIYADFTKLKQSLLNLVSNAAKFTHEGKVTLTAERYEAEQGDWLDFVVQDEGIGMTAEQLVKVFKPFAQADSSTTRQYGGTGLGLSITQRFAEMMGGKLGVESVEGVGSTFRLRIPAVVAEP